MQKIFSEFPSTTANDWKNQLIKDLKGEPIESLIWHNENGFDIQPFYTSEDLKQRYEPAFTHADWEICVSGKAKNDKELNAELLQNLQRGASSISIHCQNRDLEVVLKDIQLNYIQATFYVNEEAAIALKTYLEKNYTLAEINCAVFLDSFQTKKDLEASYKISQLFHAYPTIKTLCVNLLPFHNQNCTASYEVALVISALVEHLEYCSQQSKIPNSPVVIKTGVNEDYFIQIAKLRAIRRLWKLIAKEYGIKNDIHLIVETSLTDKSISDSYNNLIRTTVEAMAAVAGGCNELIVTEFDALFSTNKNLAERMAVNQQLILKEESYLNKMADIACGSFYLENITDAIATEALQTFKRFEKEGGFLNCLDKNIFFNEIATQAKHYEEFIATKKQIVIGVNKFKNEKEHISISDTQLNVLQQLPINNPVLNFELENYFTKK